MKNILTLILFALLGMQNANAQRANYAKMSGEMRQLFAETQAAKLSDTRSKASEATFVCAFVRTNGHAATVFKAHGCKLLASFGNIHIVNIPLNQLANLSLSKWVNRIEAGQSNSVVMDTTNVVMNTQHAYQGEISATLRDKHSASKHYGTSYRPTP